MPEAPDPHDRDSFFRARAVLLEGREDRDARAEHGRCVCGGEPRGDREYEVGGRAAVVGVAVGRGRRALEEGGLGEMGVGEGRGERGGTYPPYALLPSG